MNKQKPNTKKTAKITNKARPAPSAKKPVIEKKPSITKKDVTNASDGIKTRGKNAERPVLGLPQRGPPFKSRPLDRCDECKAIVPSADVKKNQPKGKMLCSYCAERAGRPLKEKSYRCISCDTKLTAYEVEHHLSLEEMDAPMCRVCKQKDTDDLLRGLDDGIAETERWRLDED